MTVARTHTNENVFGRLCNTQSPSPTKHGIVMGDLECVLAPHTVWDWTFSSPHGVAENLAGTKPHNLKPSTPEALE